MINIYNNNQVIFSNIARYILNDSLSFINVFNIIIDHIRILIIYRTSVLACVNKCVHTIPTHFA